MQLALVCTLALALALSVHAAHIPMGRRTGAPAQWIRAGRADFAEPLEVTIALSLTASARDALETRFWAVSNPDSPQYQQFMSIEEIDNLIRVPAANRAAVEAWLAAAGVKAIQHYADALRFVTDVKTAETLFETQLHLYKHTTKQAMRIAAFGTFGVPAHLAASIDLVTGLNEFPVPRFAAHQKPAAPEAGTACIVPQTAYGMYKLPGKASYPSANMSQGVIEFQGQSFTPSQLQAFASDIGVPIAPLKPSHIVGPNQQGAPGTESTLDIQWIAAIGAQIDNWFWLENPTAWLYEYALHFYSTPQVPLVVSISYGWDEADQCQIAAGECQSLGVSGVGYVQRTNQEFQKIGLRGVSIVVASGDSGANGRSDPYCLKSTLQPTYPAASPYVTAVGATQLNNAQTSLPNAPKVCTSGQYSCMSGGDEVAVSYTQAHFASGGGFSNIAPRPSYQVSAVDAYLKSGVALPPASFFNQTGRGYPDMAAFGSDILITSDFPELVGGTSASSPIVAGVMALLNDVSIKKSGKPLGFLNPLLYKMHAEHPAAFHDIVTGDNKCTENGCGFGNCKGYECTKGWDPVSGLGSPVYSEMLQYIQSH